MNGPRPKKPAGIIAADDAPSLVGRRVVMVYTTPPPHIVAEAITLIRAAGGDVTLVGPQIRGYEDAAAAADRTVLLKHRAAPVPIDPDNRPVRWSLPWASVVARNLYRRVTFKPFQRTLGASTLWWMTLSRNRQAVAAASAADVLTAVDGGAIYPVWQCARRNQRAEAVNGIGPTLDHLGLTT